MSRHAEAQMQYSATVEAEIVIGPTGQAFTSSLFGQKKSVNIVLTKGSPYPFNWATRFASLTTFENGNGFVLFEKNQKVPFQNNWSYDVALLRKQLELVFEQMPSTLA